MKLLKPDFYDEFVCTASLCRDTCCAGWEIEVDGETLEKYRGLEGSFGKLVRSRISQEEDGAYFALAKGWRCPFLNSRNLCDIYIQLGENMLCDICRELPRFYQWFGDYTETGLGLCCEEACRLLFRKKEPLRFVCVDDGEPSEEGDPLLSPLLGARERLFGILQCRKYSLDQRVKAMLHCAGILDALLGREDAEGLLEAAEKKEEAWFRETGGGEDWYGPEEQILKLLEQYAELESLDGTFGERMRELSGRLPELLKNRPIFLQAIKEKEYEYEHLTVYFIYRYFMEALFDGCALPPARFAAASLLVVQLMDIELWLNRGKFSEADRIFTAKLYSKEIEYCPENMEALRTFLE